MRSTALGHGLSAVRCPHVVGLIMIRPRAGLSAGVRWKHAGLEVRLGDTTSGADSLIRKLPAICPALWCFVDLALRANVLGQRLLRSLVSYPSGFGQSVLPELLCCTTYQHNSDRSTQLLPISPTLTPILWIIYQPCSDDLSHADRLLYKTKFGVKFGNIICK